MKQFILCFVLVVLFYKTEAHVRQPLAVAIQFQDDKKQMTIEEKLEKYKGAFQIQVVNPRKKPNIPYNIDELIEKNRKENEITYVSLADDVRLKIYPKSQQKANRNDENFGMITTYSN